MSKNQLTKEEYEKMMDNYAKISGSRLARNIIQDLYNNHNESVIYSKYTKENVVSMLQNPQRNEKKIRNISRYLYIVSSHYRRLIDHYSNILEYIYYVVPTNLTEKKVNVNKFKKAYLGFVNECEKFNLEQEAKKAIRVALVDGIFCGIPYETDNSFYIKPVSPDYASISSIEDGAYNFSFDLSYFSGKEYLLDSYGDEFTKAYNAYKNDKTLRYYEVPDGICLKIDAMDETHSIPYFIGLLMEIFDIEDYRSLQKAKSENDNYKALALKLETDDDGVPKMTFEQSKPFYDQIAQNINDNIGLIMSPFEIDEFSFSDSSVSERDKVSDAEDAFWYASGTSPLLMGSSKATTSSSLLLSVRPDEALAFNILQQFERCFNRKLKKMNFAYSFKIKFTQQSIFNDDKYCDRYFKAASYGVSGAKICYAASIGLSPSDVVGLSTLEDDILGIGTKIFIHPLVSSNTMSNGGIDDTGGRPTNDSKNQTVSDSTENGNTTDTNDKDET